MKNPSPFHMEAAGSLTPELNGAPCSSAHIRRIKKKGRDQTHGTRQKTETISLPEAEVENGGQANE